jgi:hypothetical protein
MKTFESSRKKRQRSLQNFPPTNFKKCRNNFITSSGGKLKPIPRVQSGIKTHAKKIDTKDATLALWKEGKNIGQIAKERGLVGKNNLRTS